MSHTIQMTIPIARPSFGRAEEDAVVEVLRSGWVSQGPRVAEFERRFAEYVGAAHAIAVSSCTTALHLALLAAGVEPGDEEPVQRRRLPLRDGRDQRDRGLPPLPPAPPPAPRAAVAALRRVGCHRVLAPARRLKAHGYFPFVLNQVCGNFVVNVEEVADSAAVWTSFDRLLTNTLAIDQNLG